MTTAHFDGKFLSGRGTRRVTDAGPVAPVIAAGTVALLTVGIIAQSPDPLAYLVGMAPIAWLAIEGAWRLFR